MEFFSSNPYKESGGRLEPMFAESNINNCMSNVTYYHAAEYHHLTHVPRSLQFREATAKERLISHPIDNWVPF